MPYDWAAEAWRNGHFSDLPDERTEVTAGRVQKSDFPGELLDFYRRNLSARLLRSAQLQVLIDAGGGVGDRLLEEVLHGTVARVATIYGLPLSTFYNRPVLPGPSDLFELSLQVERGKWHVGLSLSGGADSLTVLDENGRCLDPGDLQLLLLESVLQDASQTPVLLSEGVTWRAESVVRQRGAAATRVRNGVWGVSAALVTGTGDERIGLGELGQVLTPDLPVPDATFAALRFLQGLARRRMPLSEWVEEVQRRYGRSALRWRQVAADVAGVRNLAGVAELEVPGLGQLERVRSSGVEDGPMEGKWSADGGHTWVWALGGAGRFLLVAEASDPEGAEALLDRVESLLH
ncbi:MAG: hypothetical protein GXO73_13060 [Calditrichaeota bacterium]|nr:hypothetical protein [Calditrichota bacterium]